MGNFLEESESSWPELKAAKPKTEPRFNPTHIIWPREYNGKCISRAASGNISLLQQLQRLFSLVGPKDTFVSVKRKASCVSSVESAEPSFMAQVPTSLPPRLDFPGG